MGSKNPEDEVASRELGALLEASVDELPELYRTVFMLREIEGLDTADAADVLAVTEDVIKTRLHRARDLLQAGLLRRTRAAASESFLFFAPRCDRVVASVLATILANGLSPFRGRRV